MNRVAKYSVAPALLAAAGLLMNAGNFNQLSGVSSGDGSFAQDHNSATFLSPSNGNAESRPPPAAQTDEPEFIRSSTYESFYEANLLQQKTTSELVELLLMLRAEHRFDTDFRHKEYELFKQILAIDGVAGIDFLLAIGYDPVSRHYFEYVYRDYMIRAGMGYVVSDYVNRFGPHPLLLRMLTDASLSHEISPLVRHDVINEFILGNADYYAIMRQAGWLKDLTESEIIRAFNNTVPMYLEDPYQLIEDVLKLDHIDAYDQLSRYLLEHPDKYRLYALISRESDMRIEGVVFDMMARFDDFQGDDKIQVALIALDFGYLNALHFLLELTREPVITERPLNISHAILSRINTPDYVSKSLNWARANVDALTFNPFTRRFDY